LKVQAGIKMLFSLAVALGGQIGFGPWAFALGMV
jgi:hypothetical protein